MPTYFGYTSIGINHPATGTIFAARNKGYITGFTCPGVGTQIVKEISVYCAKGAEEGNIRVAIYDASHNLIGQGSAEVALSATPDWQGHLTQISITPNPCCLNGGQQYDLAFSFDATDSQIYYDGGSAGDYTYEFVDKTGGFDAFLPDASDTPFLCSVRCGVDPSGGGPADDRFRGCRSQLVAYSIDNLRRCSEAWAPRTGILNPSLDAQEDNDSRMIN